MKSLKSRLLLVFVTWTGGLLAGLFLLIGQLFTIYEADPERNAADLWRILALCFGVALILSLLVGARLIQAYTQPIEDATKTALELAKGNFRARASESGTGYSMQLSKSINVLARSLQEVSSVREMEQERLKTLIESMGSGLIMIGRRGHVSLVNRSFLDEFGLAQEETIGTTYKDLALPEEMQTFIHTVFMTENAAETQMELTAGIGMRHVSVYGTPVIGTHERWLGIVIVVHDITELKRLEQVRKDFVANVSHELRTPVTSIKGFSETLLEGAYEDRQSLLTFLEIIHKESNRLELLIHDLLELSKIENHGFHLNISQTDMEKVTEQALELVRPIMQDKMIEAGLETEGNVVIEGDMNRLVQVVVNLLSNAAVYSPEQTEIRVRLKEQETEVLLSVADQGIGIGEAEIPRIFERFYRVDRARSRNSGGTGLGLAIVKHLIEAHHGRISVTSKVGEGTTFHVALPKKQPAEAS